MFCCVLGFAFLLFLYVLVDVLGVSLLWRFVVWSSCYLVVFYLWGLML